MPDFPDPFPELQSVIDHSQGRINDLERAVGDYIGSTPCDLTIEPNPDGATQVHKVVFTKDVPLPAKMLAFEIVTHLRSALDRAGYAIARAHGKSGDDAHFPFGDNLVELQGRRGKGRYKDLPGEVFDAMVALQPYQGGNDLLWSLNKFTNTNKHEILVPYVVSAILGEYNIFIGPSGVDGGVRTGPNWPPRWDGAKKEMVFFTTPVGTAVQMHLRVYPSVLLGDVKGIGGKPAVPTLREIASQVQGALEIIEAEARRLGLFA